MTYLKLTIQQAMSLLFLRYCLQEPFLNILATQPAKAEILDLFLMLVLTEIYGYTTRQETDRPVARHR